MTESLVDRMTASTTGGGHKTTELRVSAVTLTSAQWATVSLVLAVAGMAIVMARMDVDRMLRFAVTQEAPSALVLQTSWPVAPKTLVSDVIVADRAHLIDHRSLHRAVAPKSARSSVGQATSDQCLEPGASLSDVEWLACSFRAMDPPSEGTQQLGHDKQPAAGIALEPVVWDDLGKSRPAPLQSTEPRTAI